MRKYLLLIAALNITFFITAQVHVRDEPRHHNVFENEFVRILDVHLGPADTTLYHLHNTPSVFIRFTNSNVGSQLWGKQPQKGANVSGEVSYDSMNTPRTHRVWNDDTVWFHVIDIELTAKGQKGKVNVLQDPLLKLIFDEQQVTGYSFELTSGKNLQLPASPNGYLLVSLNTSNIYIKISNVTQHRFMKAGHYEWIEQGKQVSLSRAGRSTGKFVLLQLK